MDKALLAGLTREQREFVLAIDANTEGLTAVSTGPCPGCETCRNEYGVKVPCECKGEAEKYCDACDDKGVRPPTMAEFEEQWHSDELCCEGFFSWQGCDLCGSPLGGNFELWHAVDANGEIIHGENACVDCVCYLANGDLPE